MAAGLKGGPVSGLRCERPGARAWLRQGRGRAAGRGETAPAQTPPTPPSPPATAGSALRPRRALERARAPPGDARAKLMDSPRWWRGRRPPGAVHAGALRPDCFCAVPPPEAESFQCPGAARRARRARFQRRQSSAPCARTWAARGPHLEARPLTSSLRVNWRGPPRRCIWGACAPRVPRASHALALSRRQPVPAGVLAAPRLAAGRARRMRTRGARARPAPSPP